jgi:uncharacterized protein YjiK
VKRLVFVAVLSFACTPAVPDARATDGSASATSERSAPETSAHAPSRAATVPANEPQTTEPMLASYDFENPVARFDLPGRLDEISGLAMTDDGRLFAHDDERGRVHEIDPVTGVVGKRFDLGGGDLRGDFEAIATVGERMFMVTSLGFLYEFREGADRESIGYRVTNLEVGDACEVEGLDHDPVDDALLVACKVSAPDRGEIVVHRFPVEPGREALPPLRVPKAGLRAHGLEPEFNASAIVVTASGTFLLVAGPQEVLIEVDRAGDLVAAVQLDRDRHPQPEGLELGEDGALYVSDERNDKRNAHLTVYARRPAEGPS